MAKATIYIDADEEITGVIDKVVGAEEKVVALVLPKRAGLFQSTVNLKLLQRAAKKAKKSLVLISSEPALNAAAAAAGVHMAKTLSSKPIVPKKKTVEAPTTIDTEELDVAEAAEAVAATEEAPEDTDQPIELDNTTDEHVDGEPIKKDKKKPKFKIPDFRSFKVRMTIGITLLALLITGWVFGFVILPKATVTIDTDTQRVDIATEFRVDTSQEQADIDEGVLPATLAEVTNKDTATVEATGEKDTGKKATGTLTLTNCREGALGVTIPAGTGFTAEGNTYSTDSAVELGPAIIIGGECRSSEFPDLISPSPVQNVTVTANDPGESFNIDSQGFQSPTGGVTAFGSDMTGGTTKIVTVVSSEDIKNAEDQLTGSASAEAVAELRTNLSGDGLRPLEETLQESDATTSNSKSVDDEADEVTVTRTVTFSMLGVSEDDLNAILNKVAEEQIDDATRNIRDNGLSGAQLQLVEADDESDQTLRLQTVATIGQVFDEEAIKQEVAGKKRGEIESLLEAREGVRGVTVEYNPLWVTTTPKSADKITIIINEIE